MEPDDPRYDLQHVGESCICSGDDGLFADPQFDRLPGVLFVDNPGYGHFFPNFYSETMNFHQLCRDISQNMETNTSELLELLQRRTEFNAPPRGGYRRVNSEEV